MRVEGLRAADDLHVAAKTGVKGPAESFRAVSFLGEASTHLAIALRLGSSLSLDMSCAMTLSPVDDAMMRVCFP